MPNNEEEQDSGYRKPKWKKQTQRQQMDRRLESAGLLNYQTKGLSQSEISNRYAQAGIRVNANWYKQNYGDDQPAQRQQPTVGSNWSEGQPNPEAPAPQPISVGRASKGWDPAKTNKYFYQTDPNTGLATKMRATSANSKQVQAGQANWTDVFVAERKRILSDPLFYQTNQITKYPEYARQQMLADPAFQWDKLPKLKIAGVDTGINWQKLYFEASSSPVAMGAIQGAIMGLGNPKGAVGGAALGAIAAAAGYDQNKEAWQQGDNPSATFTESFKNKFTWDANQLRQIGSGAFGYMNMLAEWAEKAIGMTALVANAAADPNKEVADVFNMDTLNASASFGEAIMPALREATNRQKDGRFTIEDAERWVIPGLFAFGTIKELILNPEKYKGEELYLGAAMPEQLKQTWVERLDQARAEIAKGRNYREVATEMQTGIMGQIGDMAIQGVFDPLNVMPKVETGIVRKGAELAGNKTLAEAFTGVETPREGLQKYKVLVQTGEAAKLDPNFNAQKLSPLGKWMAGLNKEGAIKTGSLLPTNKGLLDADPKKPTGGLFEETPQSRAQTGASMFDRNIGTLLHMFNDPREAAGYLRRIASGDMTAWAEMGSTLGNSPEWYTILPALKDYTGEKLTALAEAWELTATNRDALNRMAEVLGVDPTKLIDDWAARNTLAQDLETIKRKATETNTPASHAILADIASGAINADTLKQIVDIFHGEGAIPHNEAQWKWAMYADMSDHFAEWVATHLQLDKSPEAQSVFFQTMGILKQAQSLVLLGLSPGYAITNGLSGIVHLAATGVYGNMTPKQMTDWITRWETPIPRLDEGVGIGGLVDTAKSTAISDAVKGKGPLTTIKQTLSKLQRGMPMSKLSSKFESVNSKRGYVTGIRQFWSKSWRRGVGFRKMEPALVAILKEAGINPDHIYAAIEAGVNQSDIERALTGQYRGMQASALVEEAARQAGVTPAEAADMLTKSGVTDLLDTYLKGADTPDKIDAAFKRADDHMQRWIDIKHGEELATRAEEVRAIVSKEGIAAGLKIAQQNSDLFYKAWFDHYERFGDIMAGIDGLDGRMADIAIEEAYRQSDINFRRVFANMANNYKAIFDVWGLSGNADAAAAMHAISDMNNSMKSAYDFMRKTMREMKSKAAAEGRRPTGQEWSDAQSKIDKAFEQGFKEKRQAYFRMGEALGKVYTQLHGKNAGEAARAWWNDISKFTEKIEADEKRFREEIKAARDMGADPADIQEAKRKYYSENKRLFMSDLQKINDDGIARLERIIKNKGGDATPTPAPIEPTPPSDAGPTAAPAKKLTKAQEKAAKIQEEINALIAENEQVDAQERATRAQQTSAVWDIAEGYWGKGGNYSRGILNDKFALLNALKNPAYQGIPDLLGLWDARLTPEKVTEILDNRKAIKEAEKAAATPPSIKEIKKRKAKAPEDINILDAIRGYGGLNIAKITDYANDKRVGSLFGLFTKQKYGKGWDITDMARYLAGDKYDINLDDPNDPGGVNQTQELLRRALAGEKIYPTTHDYTADTAKIDAAELAHIEALKADEAAFAAEQFNAETWKARMQEAIATKNGEAVDELFGELPDEIANTAHDADGETYAEYVLRAQNNIEADAINDARATSTATAKTDADTFVKAQEDASERATTRTLMLESWTEIFGAEQAQTYMEMSDAIAQWYERTTGGSADEFYSRYYEEVRRSAEADVIGNLEQSYRVGENIQNRTLTEQDAQNYARMLARSESEARNMIANEPNKADRIAILRALEEINPDMAERIAQEETNTLYQLADTQTIEWARKKFDATGKIVNRAWVLPDGTILEAGFSHGDKTSQMISDGAIRVWLTESSGFINKDTGKGVKTLRLELEGKLTRAQRYALEPYMTDKVIIDFTKDRYPVKGNGFIEANGIDEAMKYLRQAEGFSAKGAITFDAAGIKATIHAFEAADFSTLVHENAHVFRRVMKDVAERTGNKQVVADLATIEEWAGVKDGAWTRKAEEKFARGFEKYIRDGQAPTPKLKAAFETFRKWMVEIYRTIKGSDIDVKVTDEVRAVFDRMLGAEQIIEGGRQAGGKVEASVDGGAVINFADGGRNTLTPLQVLENGGIDAIQKIVNAAQKNVAESGGVNPLFQRNKAQVSAAQFDMFAPRPEAEAPAQVDMFTAQPETTDTGTTGGLLPGMQSATGMMFDVQPGTGSLTKMQTGNARTIYDIDPTKTAGEFKPGDIVQDADGKQHTVSGANMRSKIVTDKGRILDPKDVTRVAKQETLFQRADEAGAGQNVKEAARLWKEMGVRSPYFKNWFGDWEVQSNKSGADNNGRVTRNDRDGASSIGRDGQSIEGMPDTKGLSEDSRSTRSSVLRIIAESRGGDRPQGSVKAASISNGVGIVGSSGEPAILYHGTKDLIDAFDPYHHNRKDFGWMGRGVYLTDDPSTGKTYSDLKRGSGKPTVMSLYAAVKNPFVADPIKLKENLMFKDQAFIDQFTDALKEQGYDGVIATYPNGAREIAAFYPEQVKSVDNRGTFDPSDPRILFQSADQPIGTVEEAGQQPPHAQIMDEGYTEQIRPLLAAMQNVARDRLNAAPLDGATRDMTPEGANMLKKYQAQVRADMASTKNAATKWGESQRDFAMLNYNKRYGLDRWAETVYPYQFFYTRSAMAWAARALDKPAIFSQYARLKRQQDRYERDIPERLRGKIKIPMPWLPDWMGDALYIDPIKNLFTPLNFMRPFERMIQDNTYQQIEAERILQEWEADQSVPSSDIATARNTREGATWERAFAEAQIRRESEINTPFDFLSTMFGPAWYLTTPLKLAGITTFPGAEGGKETISSTPILNTARALDTVTQGTWAEPFGDIAGLLAWPEEQIRKKLGLPEFGEYGDYYVDRQLTNMVVEGLITSDEAQIAMIERKGETFDQARERVKMELAVRVPTAAALLTSLNADNLMAGVGRLVATLPPSLFGSGLLPAGEIEYRGLKQEWNEMWKMVDAGDKDATGKFFDEHPEYEAYLAKNKKPEERMKSFLVSQVWDGYNALGKTDKKSFQEAAPNFQRDFLEEETRAPLNVDVETLTQWAQMLSQSIPNTPATAAAIENPIAKPEYFDPAITKVTDRYFSDRTKLFPNYFVEQNGYFDIPKSDKSAKYKYLKEHPNLKKYWDWNDAYAKKYPDLVPIFKNQVFKQIDTSAWPPALLDYVIVYAYTGEKLPKGAYKALKQVWIAEGQPYGDMDSWLASEVAPALLHGGQP